MLGEYGYTISLDEDEEDNNFGNYRLPIKLGWAFNDLNNSHSWDPDEPGLSGWEIRAYYDDNETNGQLDPAEYAAGPGPG